MAQSPTPAGTPDADAFPDARWKRVFRRRLLAWFDRHARDLPWRHTCDPYRIWISEIMLQQTQVATVIEYFERFMRAFPTVLDLAAAREEQVLRLWEGLGYYRRARQLHRAAGLIVAEHGGRFPSDPQAMRALPGIGRYTAGAIASIAWDAREPILEANTVRLLARLLAYRDDPTAAAGQRRLWDFSEALLPSKNVGTFNQALMELGSTICVARLPRCDRCPIGDLCPTRRAGLQDAVPAPSRKTAYEAVVEAAVVIGRGRSVLLRRCGAAERWAGLWDFPRFRIRPGRRLAVSQELTTRVAQLTGAQVQIGPKLATFKHSVTRYRITLVCYQADWRGGRLAGPELRWVPVQRMDDYPLSVTGRKIAGMLQDGEHRRR